MSKIVLVLYSLCISVCVGCSSFPSLTKVTDALAKVREGYDQAESVRAQLRPVLQLVCAPETVRPEIVDECSAAAQAMLTADEVAVRAHAVLRDADKLVHDLEGADAGAP